MLAELHMIGGLLTLINPTNHKGVAPYATKQFKSAKAPAADMLRQVVSDAGRLLPLAMVRSDRRTVMVNVKTGEAAASALVERAKVKGLTRKQFICHPLAAAGVPVDRLDLEDRTPRQRAA